MNAMCLDTSRHQQAPALAALILGFLPMTGCSPVETVVNDRTKVMDEIYSQSDWYRERPEPERSWRGVLGERRVTAGPAARVSASFVLTVSETERLPVYAAGVQARLAPFVGRRVSVRGKLVDLGPEGYGKELWIGAVAIDPR